MKELIFTARKLGAEEYVSVETQGLDVSVTREQGGGSLEHPFHVKVRVKNNGAMSWRGVFRVALPVQVTNPRFFLPGVIYGTNRGEAPLVVDSKCPRLRKNGDFPASPWWMVRSDRLSHPCAFLYGEGRMVGFSASPYFLYQDDMRKEWEPGVKGGFNQYTGFGCSLQSGEVWYTLGYENAPWLFVDSHKYFPRAPLGENCFEIEAGETVSFCMYCFDYPVDDERGLHDALKWVYGKYHELPRQVCSVRETVRDMATAIARDAWLPERHMYSGFVFDRGDRFEYNPLPSIAWTNGLAAAVPMLTSAIRLKEDKIRQQALDCINHIVENSINEKNGLPYMVEQDGVWNNRGWWYDRLPAPGHAAYLVGQSVYLILKAYVWEKEECGTEHEEWLAFVKRVLAQTEKSRNTDGEYPYVFSEKTGAGLAYDSFSGAWCMAAAAYYTYLTEDKAYLANLLRSESYYHDAYVRHQECYGGPLDIDKNIDSEGILAYIRGVRYLHEITGEAYLLEHLKDALDYEYTFKFCYNSPIKVPPLSVVGWSSCGGSITSVTNPHIHPMSSSILDEMVYYLSKKEDAYIRSRFMDTLLWSCQCHMTKDKEYGYGRKGWMSERFCHSEGLLTEHYPDGSIASTWFALMPWACGSILEGLTGDAFDNSEFEKYKVEAKEKWGQTDAYKEHAEKTKDYSKDKWDNLIEEMNGIFAEFAVCMKASEMPESDEVQSLVKALQKHITENYYHCTNEILVGLGQMYVFDERFRKNIDKHGDGTAEYVSEAIKIYCRK